MIGGCEDEEIKMIAEFREPSRQLIDKFARGEMTLALSALTLRELGAAPARVRKILGVVPSQHTEVIDLSEEAEVLAAKYIERGVLSSKMLADALHIAAATLAGVDVLVSWNFKHVVNLRRIQAYNEVNRDMGYGALDIRTPREISDDERDE